DHLAEDHGVPGAAAELLATDLDRLALSHRPPWCLAIKVRRRPVEVTRLIGADRAHDLSSFVLSSMVPGPWFASGSRGGPPDSRAIEATQRRRRGRQPQNGPRTTDEGTKDDFSLQRTTDHGQRTNGNGGRGRPAPIRWRLPQRGGTARGRGRGGCAGRSPGVRRLP